MKVENLTFYEFINFGFKARLSPSYRLYEPEAGRSF
jgi:hypothetical protein